MGAHEISEKRMFGGACGANAGAGDMPSVRVQAKASIAVQWPVPGPLLEMYEKDISLCLYSGLL